MRKLMHFSYSHPWIVLLIIFSISIFFAFQVDKLRQDPSAEGMMIDGDPDKLIYEETIKIFGTDKMSVIFIRDKELFTPRKLKIIENLVYDLEDLPGSIKVESLFSVTNFKIEDGLLNNAPLIEGVPESKKETLQIRKDVLRNPLLVGNIVSKDGRALAIKVYMDHDSDDPNFNKKFTERIELLLKPLQPDFQKIYQYGNSYFHTVMSNMMVQDQRRLVPLSLIVLILTLLATTRSLNGAILPLLTSGISILWTLGFMGIVGIPVNILTIIVPSLIIVIGSTEDIHLLSEFTEGIHLKNTRDLAFKFMVSKMGMVVMVTALTTFLGFLSICANKITILRQFGMAASFAMLVNPLVTSLLTPVYFMFIKVAKNDQEKKSPGQKRRSFLEKMAEGFTNIVINRKKGVLILSFFLAAIIGSFGVLVQLDNDIVAVFKKDSPVVQRVNEINKELSGSQYFSIRISGGHKKIFKDPKNLEQIAAIQAFISNRKLFDKSVSLVDLLKLINRELHGGETSGNIIPGSTEEISQYLLLLSDRDLERYVTFDFSEVNIFISHNLSSSYELKGAINELRAFMEKTLNPHFKFYFTGENILTLKAADTIATGQAKSIALLLLVIFIIMSVMFLNVKAGLISLLPNILPIIFYFGVMGIFSIPLNIGTAMVAAIAIGISVDDTIHFMIRFNNEMHRLKNQEQAMRLCISTEIQPVFSTSVSLALGFLVLAFSNFSTIIHFGVLSALVMAVAFFCDMLITPILLSSTRLLTLWDVLSLRLRTEVVERSEFFRDMRPWQIKKIVLLGRIKEARAGDHIFREWDEGDSMSLLLEGTAYAYSIQEKTDKEVVYAQFSPGDLFGEICMLDDCPRAANVSATTDIKYVEISRDDFQRLHTLYPHIASKAFRNLARILGHRLVITDWMYLKKMEE